MVLEERGVCKQGEGIVDVDLEEVLAEVDVRLSVKQCENWILGILVELHRISTYLISHGKEHKVTV